MITGELKNKIDGLWDVFAAGGLVNPQLKEIQNLKIRKLNFPSKNLKKPSS